MPEAVPAVMCYLIQDGKCLMIQRQKPPHKGLWSAVGGKIDSGESPRDAVLREFEEETGLTLHEPQLRGVSSIIDEAGPEQWLAFIYEATDATGTLTETREGPLRWMAIAEITAATTPATDLAYFNEIAISGRSFEAEVQFESTKNWFRARIRRSDQTRQDYNGLLEGMEAT